MRTCQYCGGFRAVDNEHNNRGRYCSRQCSGRATGKPAKPCRPLTRSEEEVVREVLQIVQRSWRYATRDRAEWEEEVLLLLTGALQRWNGRQPLRPYLMATLWRAMSRAAWTVSQRQRPTEPLDEAHQLPATGPLSDPEGTAVTQVMVEQVMRALSPEEQEALRLRFWGGLSVEEIAHRQRVSWSGARSRLRRALEVARGVLFPEGTGGPRA